MRRGREAGAADETGLNPCECKEEGACEEEAFEEEACDEEAFEEEACWAGREDLREP